MSPGPPDHPSEPAAEEALLRGPAAGHDLRVGDAERDDVISQLGEHYALGRLTREEFDDRQGLASSARTAADLRPLLADLPVPATSLQPTESSSSSSGRALRPDEELKAKVASYITVNAGLWILWAVLGFGFPWPIFPTVFWGLGLLSSTYGPAQHRGASDSSS